VLISKIYNISFCKYVFKKGKYQRTAASLFHAVFVVLHAISRCIHHTSRYFTHAEVASSLRLSGTGGKAFNYSILASCVPIGIRCWEVAFKICGGGTHWRTGYQSILWGLVRMIPRFQKWASHIHSTHRRIPNWYHASSKINLNENRYIKQDINFKKIL
jgi:hypothetical protein